VVVVALVAVLGLVAVGTAFVLTRTSGDRTADPQRPGVDVEDPAVVAADRFAAAVASGAYTGIGVTDVTLTPVQVGEQVEFTLAGLLAGGAARPQVQVTEVERGTGEDTDTASASVRFTWTFPGERVWTYDTGWVLIDTVLADGSREWRVSFEPAALLPRGVGDGVPRVVRVPVPRGRILDVTGRSLVPGGGTVTVGIRPSRTDDPAGTARTVAALTGVDADELAARVLAAGPDEFVEVVTLERPAYDLIRAQIQPLPGTVFTEQAVETDLPTSFARGVLGSTGSATPEIAQASEGAVVEGDLTGLSGIQAGRNATLAGSPGLRIEAVATDGSGDATVLHEFPGQPGTDVTVTLDAAVQLAADATVAVSSQPVGLVAIRVSTGEVIAVANGPAGSAGYNRALLNRYPPGSTFKVVSALAYLEAGLQPDDVVACPATVVAGKRFKNAGEFALGDVPFHRAFARSCNTTFVSRSSSITPQQLTDTARLLGFRDLDAELGMDVFGTEVPLTDDETMHAADSIGQGKVEGSALSVALMAASVANGTSLSPRLFVEPGAPAPAPGAPLPAGPVAALREMMREVVTDGTGSALAGVPGGPVHAKTGTAEFGTDDPPRSHAWIAGYQGDIAFAVVVEDGGGGGAVAGPVAALFLTTVAGG
jgi:cell division protein FtsI/penicillin-binding protein 2